MTRPDRYLLRCRDRQTFRSATRLISLAYAYHPDPSLLTNLIMELAVSITVSWPHAYGVAFPHDRAEWDVIGITEAAAL